MQSRREWFKSSIGLGGLMMAPSILTAEEIKKYNPRNDLPICVNTDFIFLILFCIKLLAWELFPVEQEFQKQLTI